MITQVQVVSCPEDTIGAECGSDLIKNGWERRDVDLNGPTANGSHIYLFTSTEPTEIGDCVGRLALVNSTDLYPGETSDVDVKSVSRICETSASLISHFSDGTGGSELYLRVIRSGNHIPGSCLTSIIPLDLGYYTPKAHYEPVRDDDGSPANFNDGVLGADPVFVYTSTMSGIEDKQDIRLSLNETGEFKIALYSDLHYGSQDTECQDVPSLVRVTAIHIDSQK